MTSSAFIRWATSLSWLFGASSLLVAMLAFRVRPGEGQTIGKSWWRGPAWLRPPGDILYRVGSILIAFAVVVDLMKRFGKR